MPLVIRGSASSPSSPTWTAPGRQMGRRWYSRGGSCSGGGEREAGSMPPSPAEPSGCFDSFHHMVSQNPKEIWGWGPAESKQPWGFSAEGRGVRLPCPEAPVSL